MTNSETKVTGGTARESNAQESFTQESFAQEVLTGCESAGITISNREVCQLYVYTQLVLEWNQKINLTAITDLEGVVYKHIIDSLMVNHFLPHADLANKTQIIDVGTGAGFPGIPIAITNPNIQVTLLDSLAKRVSFLNHTIAELGLKNASAIHFRAEDAGHLPMYREKYDVAIARAVASLPVLAEYCVPLVRQGGSFIAMKGPDAENELRIAVNAYKKLGCDKAVCTHRTLPELNAERCFITSKKIFPTPKAYPRKAGTPSKKPL